MSFLITTLVYSQSDPYAQVNTIWHYNYYPEGSFSGFMTIHAEKDTFINGRNCSMLIKSVKTYDHILQLYSEYSIDTNYMTKELDKVFLLRDDTFNIIYDFSLNIGDSLIIPASVYSNQLDSTGCYHILSKGDTVINGKQFKYIDVYSKIPTTLEDGYDWGFNGRILEDIGPCNSDLLPNQQEFSIPPGYINGSSIRCYSDSFFSMQIVSCDSILHVPEYPYFEPFNVSIYPMPVVCSFTISISDNNPHDCLIIDEQGLIVTSFDAICFPKEIDASGFNSGLYFLIIDGISHPILKL